MDAEGTAGRRSAGRRAPWPSAAARPRRPRRRAGPSAPRPAGTMRAPRAKLEAGPVGRARAWAAAKKASPKPSATEPATTASAGRAGRTTDGHRPTDEPARCAPAPRAAPRPAARPVTAAMAVPDASASRQPRPPHGARPAVGLDDDVADVAGVAVGAVEQPAVEHDAAAHAGGHDHGDEVAHAPGRAAPALAEGERLGVVVDAAPAGRSAPPAAPAAGSPASPGC